MRELGLSGSDGGGTKGESRPATRDSVHAKSDLHHPKVDHHYSHGTHPVSLGPVHMLSECGRLEKTGKMDGRVRGDRGKNGGGGGGA